MNVAADLTLEKRIFRPNICISKQFSENIMFIIDDGTIARSLMLEQIGRHFSLYQPHLTGINNFAKTYQSKHAAHWYTKDSFLHRIINKVLRNGNLESYNLYLLRYYLADLSEQIYQLKCHQQRNVRQTKENTTLYRGLRLSITELKTLKRLVGQVILTKGFMSTTADIDTALFFAAPSHSQSPESQSLLLEISVDMTTSDIIAADISHLSEFPDEKEVLFDIGNRFKVESLEYDSLHAVWYCRLVVLPNEFQITTLSQPISFNNSYVDLDASSNKETKLKRVGSGEHRRKFAPISDNANDNSLCSNSSSIPWIACSTSDRVCILHQRAVVNWFRSLDMRRCHSELKHAWNVLKSDTSNNLNDSCDAAMLLNNLGYTCQRLKNTDEAIKLLIQSYEIRSRIGSSGHFRAQSLINLGQAYIDKGLYDDAFTSLNQALTIGQQSVITSQWSTSISLCTFVYFYHKKGDYRQAIEYYFRAIEILEQCINLAGKCYGK